MRIESLCEDDLTVDKSNRVCRASVMIGFCLEFLTARRVSLIVSDRTAPEKLAMRDLYASHSIALRDASHHDEYRSGMECL